MKIPVLRVHPRGSTPPVAEIPDLSPGRCWVIPEGDSYLSEAGRAKWAELFREGMADDQFTCRAAPLAIILRQLHALGGQMTHSYQYLADMLSQIIPTDDKTVGEIMRDQFKATGLVRIRHRVVTGKDGKRRRTSSLIELTLPSKLGKRIRRFRPRVIREVVYLPSASYLPHPTVPAPVYTQQRGHRRPLLRMSMGYDLLLSGLPTIKGTLLREISSVYGAVDLVDNLPFSTK